MYNEVLRGAVVMKGNNHLEQVQWGVWRCSTTIQYYNCELTPSHFMHNMSMHTILLTKHLQFIIAILMKHLNDVVSIFLP